MPPDSDALDLRDVLEHEEWLRPLARQLARDDDVAEDLVQETIVAAWRRPPSDRGALPAWLKRVLSNLSKMQFRGDQRRTAREQLAANPEATQRELPLEILEVRRSVVRALMELAEPYRSTLVLRYYEEWSAAEIARVEGIPASTVRVRLKRGLERMRERLEAEHGDCRGALLLLGGVLDGATANGVVVDSARTTARPETGDRLTGPGDRWGTQSAPRTNARRVSRGARVRRRIAVAAVGAIAILALVALLGLRDHDDTPIGIANDAASEVFPSEPRSTSRSTRTTSVAAIPLPLGSRDDEPRSAPTAILRVLDEMTDTPIEGARIETGEPRLAWNQIADGFDSSFEFLLADPCPDFLGTTDAHGELRVPVRVLEEASLEIMAPDHAVTIERATRRGRRDDSYTVRLRRPLPTRVSVRTSSGARVEEASVTVLDHSGVLLVEQGSDIEWRKRRAMELVRVEAPGFAATQDLLTAPTYDAILVPGRSAVGRVVDAEGTPVVGAIVECRWDGWRGPPALTSTDVAGLFSTPALPTVGTNPDERGTLSLSITVRHADHPIETRRFELAPSMTSREDDLGEIALAVGRSILGRIVDVDGRPVAGATVIAFPADDPGYSREMQRTTTGDDGWFRFSAVRDREVRLLVEPIALPATEFTATCDVESHCVVARGEPLRIRVRTVGGEPARDVAIRLGTILGDELRGPIARTNAEGIATFAQAPVGPVRHHARRRVLRWTALDAIDDVPTDQAIAELFAPEQLVRCDGVDVPSPAHHGSRNTGAIDLRRREHELVIEDPSERAPVDFRLIDREGRTLHVFTNVLVVSPDDWVMKDFAGLDGRPVHVSCPDVLDGAQLTVMSRGYCWQTEWVDLERTARRVEVALTPTPDRPTRLWIDGGAGREILLAPMVSGREPIAALVIGACDDEGELELSEIGPGRYLVATPLDDTALFQKNGRRRSALRTSAVRFLGTITVAESGGERIPLRWTDTEIPRAEIEDR